LNNKITYTTIKKEFGNHRLFFSSNYTKPQLLEQVRIEMRKKHECVKLMDNRLRQSETVYKKLDYLN